MGKLVKIPISIDRGKWSSGDVSEIPDGYCVQCRNTVLRPKRQQARDPFVYDSLMNVRGLANFEDQTNKASRMIAINSAQAFFEKATSGDTWSASLGTLSGTRLTDFANYRGIGYGMMDDGSGNPTAAFSFDGTTLSTSPFDSAIQGRCVTAFLDRLFIAYPRVTVTAKPAFGSTERYGGFTSPSFTQRSITSGATTTYRVYTTASIGSYIVQRTVSSLAASSTDQPFVARWDLRSTHPTYDLQCRLRCMLNNQIARLTAYVAGDIAYDPITGFRMRCTTGGTTAAGAPAFNVALGSQTVDGTVTWTNDGSIDFVDQDITIQNATASPGWVTYWMTGTIPKHTNTIALDFFLWTGTTTFVLPTTAVGIDIGFKDGLADGTIGKQNYGFQFILGDFRYPFVNKESSDTSTVDLKSIVWSEVLRPKTFRASATYEPQEAIGYPTAATTLGGRYIVSFRDTFFIFTGNTDSSLDVIPIRKERQQKGVGCIGPRAHDTVDGDWYFIGEDGIYRFSVGMDAPEEIGGDAMREEIMNRGSNWVESQATYNMPLLKVNKRDKEVLVYTQKGTLFVYSILSKGWTVWDVANGAEIADIIFNTNTRKMYVAVGGFGLARVDWNSAATNDTVDNTATTYTVQKDTTTRPIELFPGRNDTVVDEAAVYHVATASQSGQSLTVAASFDRGATFPFSDTVTLDITDPRNAVPIFEQAPSITLRFRHDGKAGASVWALSKIEVVAIPQGEEYPQVRPTPVSQSL